MSTENPAPAQPAPHALIRIPVRFVVLVLVLPVRMAWDALKAAGRLLDRALLRPTGRGLAWLYRHLLKRPAVWLYERLLTPTARALGRAARAAGRAIAWVFGGLWRGLAWVFGGLWRGLSWAFGGLWRGLAWVFGGLWRGLAWAFGGLWRGLSWLLGGLWSGLAWVFRGLGAGLVRLGRGLSAGAVLLGKALALPFSAFWRYVLVPVARYGIAVPAVWLYRAVLAPVGQGTAWALVRLWRGLAWVFIGLGRGLAWVFIGLGRGIAVGAGWLGRGLLATVTALFTVLFRWPWRYGVVPLVTYGIVRPAVWLWRRVLLPVGREIRDALAICWRVAGFLSRAVGRGLAWLARNLVARPVAWVARHLFVRPAAWVYRQVCTPVGHWIRHAVWAPARKALAEGRQTARAALASARDAVRQARRDTWRALVGETRADRPREPQVARARTLGSTTNVPGAAPAPEISPQTRG
ncbi:hypothetical protein ACFY7C_10765 [Streptomyces sp. NPDC012769]|uniref:hypothetical protein n=1 Tax=Streptomyces sp. NPDC012769 TaxID=3364848 RepID=UPI00367D1F7B